MYNESETPFYVCRECGYVSSVLDTDEQVESWKAGKCPLCGQDVVIDEDVDVEIATDVIPKLIEYVWENRYFNDSFTLNEQLTETILESTLGSGVDLTFQDMEEKKKLLGEFIRDECQEIFKSTVAPSITDWVNSQVSELLLDEDNLPWPEIATFIERVNIEGYVKSDHSLQKIYNEEYLSLFEEFVTKEAIELELGKLGMDLADLADLSEFYLSFSAIELAVDANGNYIRREDIQEFLLVPLVGEIIMTFDQVLREEGEESSFWKELTGPSWSNKTIGGEQVPVYEDGRVLTRKWFNEIMEE